MLTGELLRAGRALARLEQAELAAASGLSLDTIKRLERIRGLVNANTRTVMALTAAFQEVGVSFERDGDGRVCICQDAPAGGKPVLRMPSRRAPAEPAVIHRLIYYSTAEAWTLANLSQALDDILRSSLARNEPLGVTGALLACGGRFLQALEGGRDAVMQVYGAIASDPRHRDLQVVHNHRAPRRRFPDWSMCARSAADLAALQSGPGASAAFRPEPLSAPAALDLLLRVAELEAADLAASVPHARRR